MPYTRPREALNERLLLYALALSLVLHGIAIVGTPRFGGIGFEPVAEPPLEVELIAPLPPPQPAPQRVAPPQITPSRPPAPAVKKKPQPSRAQPAETVAQRRSPTTQPAVTDASPATTAAASAAAPSTATPSPATETAAYPLASAQLVFDLYYGESQTLVGEVVQRFELDENRYVASSTAEAVGFVGLFLGGRYTQRSEGRIDSHGMVPERYTVLDRGEREPERAVFDWATGTLRFERKGRVREAPLQAGAQDPLSAVHQLHFLRPLEPGLLMDVATARKVERMLFMNMGYVEVETALGPIVAAHVKRQDLDGELTEVWLDPARYFLPVRVYNRNRNGYVLTQVLREASFVPREPPSAR